VAQLVEALHYKLEGHGFDSRWCHWNFSLTQSFWPHYSPGIDSASNRSEHQECFLEGKDGCCIRLKPYHLHVPTVLKYVSVNLLEPSRPVQACTGIYLFFFFYLTHCLGSCSLNRHILETHDFTPSTCSWHTPLEEVW
jgi:hypothetical protein